MLVGFKRSIRVGAETVTGTEINLVSDYTLKPGEPGINKQKSFTYTSLLKIQ